MTKPRDEGVERFQDRLREKREYNKQLPKDDEPALPPPVEPIQGSATPGRNEPCPCGSGKKYKQCCARK